MKKQVDVSSYTTSRDTIRHAGVADVTQLLSEADIALYAAKAAGRDGFEVFSPGMTMEPIATTERSTDAPSSDDLLYYPIVDLHTDHIVGFEMRRPSRERRAPGRRGAADGLRDLQRACEAAVAWTSDVFVSVEIEAGLAPAEISRTLDAAGLPPHRLEIRTGPAAGANPHGRETLCRLREMGMGVALSRLGTDQPPLSDLATLR